MPRPITSKAITEGGASRPTSIANSLSWILKSVSASTLPASYSPISHLKHLPQLTMATLQSQPPTSEAYLVSYPAQHVVLLTINRPKVMNCIHAQGHWDMDAFFQWFDHEPSLRVAIITGAGPKAFCAGQDLIEQGRFKVDRPPTSFMKHPPGGFAGLSRRIGKKPVIAAVNGFALGGGFEITLNWLGTSFYV